MAKACELRFRPIITTSFTFVLGRVPLAIATGASQRAIGTGVLGGMVTATVLVVFATPQFYVLIARAFRSRKAEGLEVSFPPTRRLAWLLR